MSTTQQPQSPRSAFMLNFTPSGKESLTNPFHRLPVEAVSMIFANMDTWKDFKAAADTCRQAKAITQLNDWFIARTWIANMLPPSVQKLGIMAIASRQFSHDEVEEFVKQYISHEGDYPYAYKSMEVASALPDILQAAETVMETRLKRTPYPDRYPSGNSTPAEYARELRACFMIETARNLFDGSSRDLDEEEFREKKNVYWTAFSKAEVQAARVMVDSYEQYLFQALESSQDSAGECCVRDKDSDRGHFSNAQTRSLARAFSIEAGLDQMRRWYTTNFDPHGPFHNFKYQRSGQIEGYQHFDEFLEKKVTVFAQFPFQSDPEAINLTAREKFFEQERWEIRQVFCCSDLQEGLSCQILWDQDTFTAWQQQLKEDDLETWNDPANDEPISESESEFESEEEYNEDNYNFETESDWELGPELWDRWRASSTSLGFEEWMRNERMCGEMDSENEDGNW